MRRATKRAEREREMDEVYAEYYSDPKNVAAERELTEELLSIASWPE